MKKKLLSILLAICMFVPMTFSLVACGDDETPAGTEATQQSTTENAITSENITLSYTSTVYDGTEKEPNVVVKFDNKVVSSDNYEVSYSNNVNVGTAKVTITSVAGSEILAENLSFSTTFEIERAPIMVGTINELNAAIMITDSNHVIKLAKNIALQKDANDKVIPVRIFPEEKNYDVAIDLAGYDINSYIDIRSTYNNVDAQNSAKVNIFNSSSDESVVGATGNEVNYALQLLSRNDFDVTLNNIKFQAYWGGFATNGTYVSDKTSLYAENCKFISTKENAVDGTDAGVGAFLAAGKYIYTFENCEFEGFGGYYAKSGHHTLISCKVKAVGTQAFDAVFYGNGSSQTGSALVIDSAETYCKEPATGYQRGLTVDIIGGKFSSVSKYAIEEFCTYKTNRECYAFVHITDNPVYEVSNSITNAVDFENTQAQAAYTHAYTNDADSTCNICGAHRETVACDIWEGRTVELPAANAGVITITTAEQLAKIAEEVNSGNTFAGVTILLDRDIDLNNIEWIPIGYGVKATGKAFAGTFDGQNHTIYNLKISRFVGGGSDVRSSAGVGLFGFAGKSSVIKNVKIDTTNVNGNHYVGSLIGYALQMTVENCEVTNATINCTKFDADEEGDKAGAIIGHAAYVKANGISATNSVVSAGRDAGQVVGCIANSTTLRNISATNVHVSANGTSTGENVKNEVLGRDSASISLWYGEVGTLPQAVSNVITIRNASELAALARAVNAGNDFAGITIKLERDIDLDNIEWTPIGFGYSNFSQVTQHGASFRGIFDGKNKTIYNLKITDFVGGGTLTGTSAGVGLFGHIVAAEIKNVKITGAEVVGNHYVGTVVGFSLNSKIDACVVKNATVSCVYADEDESGDKAGVIVGQFARTNSASAVATISNCSATDCSVDADRDAGKLIGCLDNVSTHTGNNAKRVVVSCNNSGVGFTTKTGSHISNEIVGRMD